MIDGGQDEIAALRARVAELEADLESLRKHAKTLEKMAMDAGKTLNRRVAELEARCAPMVKALKPLSELQIRDDCSYVGTLINYHVKAARVQRAFLEESK
jgi:prefoldin subunit 5